MIYFFGKSVFSENTNFMSLLIWDAFIIFMLLAFCGLVATGLFLVLNKKRRDTKRGRLFLLIAALIAILYIYLRSTVLS